MKSANAPYPQAHIRRAAACFFLAQGLCFSTWASRIPDIKAIFGVDDPLFWGGMLMMIPAGKFIAVPLAGMLVSRLGSRVMAQVSVLGYAAALFAIGIAANVFLLAGSLFCFGVCWNLCDISLNTQGIGIERLSGRTVMATFHGAWSLAACAGALTGFCMILLDISPFRHFSLIAVLIAVIVFSGRKYLQEDAETVSARKDKKSGREMPALLHFIRKPERLLMQLGAVSLFALVVESAMFDWSAIYFESVIQAPKSLQVGFLAFMVMMTAGRFSANRAYRKIGRQRVLQYAGALIFAGFLLSALPGLLFASMTAKIVVISLGFMLVGLGISCMVPTVYSLVGAKSGTPVGIAITILSAISFTGSLVAPPLIGAISRTFNMQYAYLFIGCFGLCILLMTSFCRAFRKN
jgi:MFS family permease